jgi:AhpD family alkylhydroperoxidase
MGRVNQLKQERNDGHWNLMRFRSDTYDACQALEEIAFKEGNLSTKTKELIAVGIAIQTGCEAVIQQHIERAAGQGATFEESVEAIEVGITMGGSTAVATAHFAFHALDQLYSREILKL